MRGAVGPAVRRRPVVEPLLLGRWLVLVALARRRGLVVPAGEHLRLLQREEGSVQGLGDNGARSKAIVYLINIPKSYLHNVILHQ